MNTIAVAVAYLACLGQAQKAQKFNPHAEQSDSSQSLASILLAARPAVRSIASRHGFSSMARRQAPTRHAGVSMADDQAGKVVIVTGASRGIGKAIALELGQAGCRVVVNYAGSEAAAKEVADTIKGMGNGADAVAIKADCGDEKDIKALFAACEETWGKGETCDVLVNNAGITKDGLVMRMKEKQFRDVIDTNLVGVFLATREAAKIMMKKRSGRIINMASVVGQIGNPGQANYAASKGGVIAMARSNAAEFGARGVTVNTVCPGFIESDMTAELPEAVVEQVMPRIPLLRFGKPEEVAGMVKFLAVEPAAAYITGHCFNVDGGMAMGA